MRSALVRWTGWVLIAAGAAALLLVGLEAAVLASIPLAVVIGGARLALFGRAAQKRAEVRQWIRGRGARPADAGVKGGA